jgi:hypothetical protein
MTRLLPWTKALPKARTSILFGILLGSLRVFVPSPLNLIQRM